MKLGVKTFIKNSWQNSYNNGNLTIGFVSNAFAQLFPENTLSSFTNALTDWIWKGNERLQFWQNPTLQYTITLQREKLTFLTQNFQTRQKFFYLGPVSTLQFRLLLKTWKFSVKEDTLTLKGVSQSLFLEKREIALPAFVRKLVFFNLLDPVVTSRILWHSMLTLMLSPFFYMSVNLPVQKAELFEILYLSFLIVSADGIILNLCRGYRAGFYMAWVQTTSLGVNLFLLVLFLLKRLSLIIPFVDHFIVEKEQPVSFGVCVWLNFRYLICFNILQKTVSHTDVVLNLGQEVLI